MLAENDDSKYSDIEEWYTKVNFEERDESLKYLNIVWDKKCARVFCGRKDLRTWKMACQNKVRNLVWKKNTKEWYKLNFFWFSHFCVFFSQITFTHFEILCHSSISVQFESLFSIRIHMCYVVFVCVAVSFRGLHFIR